MNALLIPALIVATFLAALWLTGRIRDHALKREWLDVPNARSSHAVVTPRGGGVAIVATFLIAVIVLGVAGTLDWRDVLAIVMGGLIVALIGLADDQSSIPARWRLLGHFAGAACVIAWSGQLPVIELGPLVIDSVWVQRGLATLFLVWLLNLTNFMDGIDGIAAIETITVCAGAALLNWAAGSFDPLPLALASATAGFLIWNWPPARIFLGDAGSGFLGLMFGTLALHSGRVLPELFWGWLILLGVFIVDATFTLARRVSRGEKFYMAHRSHAYQHASQLWRTHKGVTIAVGLINVLWLLPIAMLVVLGYVDGFPALIVAYVPLFGVAIRLKAGSHTTFPQRSSGLANG